MNSIGMNKLPPQAVDIEESILARCMVHPEDVDDMQEILSHKDFYRSAHQKIFQAISKMSEKKIYPDLPALANYLKDQNILEEIGGAAYLSRIIDTVPIALNVKHYCDIVRGKSILRELIEKCSEISNKCFEANGDVDRIIDSAQKDILSIDIDREVHDFVHIKEMADERFKFYEERFRSSSELTGISSGYPKLDYITAGFQETDLIILAGRPSHGKTAFSLNLIRNAAKENIKSGIFSLEMSQEQLFDRIIAIESKINSTKFRTGRFRQEDWQLIADSMSEILKWNVVFETLSFEMPKIIRKCRKMKKSGVEIIFIDYLSLVEGDKSRKRHEEVASNARAFKRLAKELGIPIVLLVQLNRGFKDRQNKRPMLHDLRESGEIEQAADVVMFVYRKELDTKNDEDSGYAEIIIEKQRNGPLGNVEFYFNKYTTHFGIMDK